MKLEKIKEVGIMEQCMATMNFLEAMGFDNTKLTGFELINIKRALGRVIEEQSKIV